MHGFKSKPISFSILSRIREAVRPWLQGIAFLYLHIFIVTMVMKRDEKNVVCESNNLETINISNHYEKQKLFFRLKYRFFSTIKLKG
jgi:hypothetical protein